MMEWGPILLSIQLALVTTLVLLIIGVPLAWWLAFTRNPLKPAIETLVSMPLVLPPTVLGFYLLVAFSPNQFPGRWFQEVLGLQLIFSFQGLVIASVLYSLPFMVQPIQSGFATVPHNLREASYAMGKSVWQTAWRVVLPYVKPSVITGIVLSFAHTMGEFGVVLMIGGNIPDKTRVASIAIYDEVEALRYGNANRYSLVLLAITFLILFLVYRYNGQRKQPTA